MKGRYQTHKDILHVPGEGLEQSAFEVLARYNSVDSLLQLFLTIQMITWGIKLGFVSVLKENLSEQFIKKALHFTTMSFNERPLHHIIEQLDGGTKTLSKFSSEIGKATVQDHHNSQLSNSNQFYLL